jgi:hypothetical protein
MTHAEAIQRLEEIERQRLDLFNVDKSGWTAADRDRHTYELIRLAQLEQLARLALNKSHPLHLAPARTGG